MKEDDGPQNVYDDPQFFAGYAEMERFRGKWGAAMEHRSFDELVGDTAGQRAPQVSATGADRPLR